jgi:hypothetical protein
MFKLNNLIISGTEVYSVPTPPRPRFASEPADGAAGRRTERPSALLLHTLAVGGLPLPGRRR